MSSISPKEIKKALSKKATLGPDVDLGKYSAKVKKRPPLSNLRELPPDYQNTALKVGVEAEEKRRSGSFFQLDHSVICARASQEGLEVMSTTEALKKYDWLKFYWWKAVSADRDKYTAQVDIHQTHGYFIRAKPGVKATFPLQACLFIGKEGIAQNVHNIIIAEEDSELQVITGCTTASNVKRALHIGVSEFYVKKNAKLNFTMIHSWAPEVEVRPRTVSIVEDNGVFISNYICLKPVKDLQMYPTTYLKGPEARARYNSILYAKEDSCLDVGSRVYLQAKGTRAEMIARAIVKDKGVINARGHLVGEIPGVKAHLECRGLILSPEAYIHAIPELEGKTKDVDLSHEAAVGKIAEGEILYLMARGLSEEEATSAIVRGFLKVDIEGLPGELQKEMQKIVEMDMLAL